MWFIITFQIQLLYSSSVLYCELKFSIVLVQGLTLTLFTIEVLTWEIYYTI